jgi:hypothetical protein
MRNGMLVALAIYLAAEIVLHRLFGNTGLWLSIHVFFLARAALFWVAVGRNKHSLFAAPVPGGAG